MTISGRLRLLVAACISLSSISRVGASTLNSTIRVLSDTFEPAQVFENENLVRNINLERSYARETTNIVVKNIGKEAQSEYYYLIPSASIGNVGGFEAKDKKKAAAAPFKVELAQYANPNPSSYFVITFPEPLAPSESKTISITYAQLSSLTPLPAQIEQLAPQTVVFSFSAQLPSAYLSSKQKTKLKLPTSSPADYTRSTEKNAEGASDPAHQGSSLTYGPYIKISPFSSKPVSVRYDFTKALLRATKLERDIEVSHWGGNLAVEERYWLTNNAAKLKNHFSRTQWQMAKYANPPSVAAAAIRLPLIGGSANPYFIDDIGNVSTSRFRPGRREATLDITPRYPIYGGWNYSFKVGWDNDLKRFLRRGAGDQHVLKVPFMEGPRTEAGVEYGTVTVRVILPEGAQNVQFNAKQPLSSHYVVTHKTFMDTQGRPTLVLVAHNAIEEWRDRGELVITYDYPWYAVYRKPLTIAGALFALFTTAWIAGNIDVRIGKQKVV